MSLRALILGLVAFAALPADAATVASRTIVSGGWGYLQDATSASYITWTQTGTFSSVSVAVPIYGSGGTGTGNAYLTTAIGPGTTVAQQVATTPISTTNSGPTTAMTTLFSGLTLVGPATYYLTIASTSSTLRWTAYFPTTEATGAGVTIGYDGDSQPYNVSYPPASTFYTGSNEGYRKILFSITGNVGGVSPTVPTLSAWAVFGTALLLLSSGLLLIKRYRPQE